MANKVKTKEEIRQENIETSVSRTEEFYNSNKKKIWTVFCSVVIVVLAILAYNRFIYTPQCAEAASQTFPAETSFQQENYELALNGDGNILGFAQIIDQYGAKAGQAVYLYAGICALHTGAYEDALNYLGKYKGKEPILAARAIACQGDAYVQLENYEEAVKCFGKAAAKADNAFAATYLFKEGLAYEKLGQNAKAAECYKAIKENYPQSVESFDIDRYIKAVEE